MRLKTKLIASIMSICLVCAVFAIGVFALKTANLKIGGDVSFSATGVEAHIRNASLSGLSTTNQDIAANDAEGEYINTSMTQSAIDTKFATWQNLTLDFDENATDIELKFEIANTSTNTNNYIEIDYSYSFSNANPNVDVIPGDENAQKAWENNNYILAPKGATPAAGDYETFTLKFKVLDKELNVPQDTKVNLTIALKHHTVKSAAATDNVVTIDNVEYTLNSPSAGFATVTGNRIPGEEQENSAVIHPVVKDSTQGALPCVVANIGEDAFSDCYGMGAITIPNSVTSIGDGAFSCCTLDNFIIPNSVTSIGDLAFECCDLDNIIIPSSVTSIGKIVFGECNVLTSIKVASGNSVYDSRNNCNAIIETASNKLIQGIATTIIPNSVTSIGEGAFSRFEDLNTITIPNSVTSIGDYAFSTSGLHTITIPSSVISIGEGAFYESRITSITIQHGLKFIGKEAFAHTDIDSITIPSSVISIGEGAFAESELSTAKFDNPIGWFKADSADATEGETVTVTSEFTEDNANVLKNLTYDEYLLRKDT